MTETQIIGGAERISVSGDGGAETCQAAAAEKLQAGRQSLLAAHMELGKARLSAMVVLTTALGFVVASRSVFPPVPFDWVRLAWTCVGTFLAAVGASAFNQAIEARRDARMKRTCRRPLPMRRLSRTYAATFGLIVCIIGVAILCPTSNGMAAVLATANIFIYVCWYTPMKTVSAANTLVGALVGGIPPMIGWAAAVNGLPAGAWVLGAILFVWQIPHFLALAWMYREDYARGGFKMISTVEPTGRLAGQLAVMYSAVLLPVCLLVVYFGHASGAFAVISVVLTSALTVMAVRFARSRTHADARRLFLASIIYLPVLTIALMITARGPLDDFVPAQGGFVLPTAEKYVEPNVASDQTPNAQP